MQSIRQLLDRTKKELTKHSIENPSQKAILLFSHLLNIRKTELYLDLEKKLNRSITKLIEDCTARLIEHEPIQYIIGETDFYNCRICLNRHILIPRPETELLVEKIIKEHNDLTTILDLGTGSGAIAICLAKHFKNAEIFASDVSEASLQLAKKNAEMNRVQINFIQSDLFRNICGKFDLIVSNPPYISEQEYKKLPAEIREFEPKKALLAQEEGLYYFRKIIENANEHLNKNGKIYFEIGYNQARKISDIALHNELTGIEIFQDLSGYDRYMKLKKV